MTEDLLWIDMGLLDSPSLYCQDGYSLDSLTLSPTNMDDTGLKSIDFQNFDLLNEATEITERKQLILNDLKSGLNLDNTVNSLGLNESSNNISLNFSTAMFPDDFCLNDSVYNACSPVEAAPLTIIESDKRAKSKRKYEESESEYSYETDNSSDTMDSTECSKRMRTSSIESSKHCPHNSKKQSNKEAAIRYRQKKLKEKEELFNMRSRLEQENKELKSNIDDIQTEINFVKNLLVEMFVKKNMFSK